MRCRICDKALTEAEIQVAPDGDGFEPCGTCMEIIKDTVYCDGLIREESLDEPELEDEFGSGSVEVFDPDTYFSSLDHDDTGFQEHSNGSH